MQGPGNGPPFRSFPLPPPGMGMGPPPMGMMGMQGGGMMGSRGACAAPCPPVHPHPTAHRHGRAPEPLSQSRAMDLCPRSPQA